MTEEGNKSNTASQPNKISKEEADRKGDFAPVSYTHLTLPTNREV